jgi:hypothetical protein
MEKRKNKNFMNLEIFMCLKKLGGFVLNFRLNLIYQNPTNYCFFRS